MKSRAKKGFTLVEILIVVIILGILAAIVIPQFTSASAEARISNLVTNLQTVRSQLLLYKTQHNEAYAGSASDATLFGKQMTQYTDVSGGVSATPSSSPGSRRRHLSQAETARRRLTSGCSPPGRRPE